MRWRRLAVAVTGACIGAAVLVTGLLILYLLFWPAASGARELFSSFLLDPVPASVGDLTAQSAAGLTLHNATLYFTINSEDFNRILSCQSYDRIDGNPKRLAEFRKGVYRRFLRSEWPDPGRICAPEIYFAHLPRHSKTGSVLALSIYLMTNPDHSEAYCHITF